MTELLTCWSCGGKATLIEDEPTQGFCFVECVDCGSRGPITTKEQAIAAWNTRAFDEDTYFSGVNAGLDAAEALERTCRLVQREDIPTEGKPCHYIECTCGHGFWWPIYEVLTHCPKCGARVIRDNEPVEVWRQASVDDVTCSEES